MSNLDAVLATATLPDGSQRFYPSFEHPATAQLRAHRDRLNAYPESGAQQEALAYIAQQLAIFEHGEDRAKRDYLARRGHE